jgi:hypothetical protein
MVSTGNPVKMEDVRGPRAFDLLMEWEQQATRIFLNQPLFVPGLLQVAGYAAGIIGGIAGLKPSDRELSERVNVRMRRAAAFEKRLQSAAPPQLWAVIDEGVLRRTTGGPAVMREQLDHLAALSQTETVHLGILPLEHGAHPGLGGSFEVHEMGGGEAAVFFEAADAHADEIVASDPALVQQCRQKAETLMASALSGAEALASLARISSSL